MKLYWFPIAPNPTRVRLYLAEKGAAGGRCDVEEVQVDLRRGEQREAAHRARNPLGYRWNVIHAVTVEVA